MAVAVEGTVVVEAGVSPRALGANEHRGAHDDRQERGGGQADGVGSSTGQRGSGALPGRRGAAPPLAAPAAVVVVDRAAVVVVACEDLVVLVLELRVVVVVAACFTTWVTPVDVLPLKVGEPRYAAVIGWLRR